MRILFVAMANSVHTARWIGQLTNEQWDIHLFPVDETPLHPMLHHVVVHALLRKRSPERDPSVCQTGLWWPFRRGAVRVGRAIERLFPHLMSGSTRLARLIQRLKPDIIHSLEMQHAGYLTSAARNHSEADFHPWIYSSWGSDIFFFGQKPEHRERIRAVLAACDYYIADCRRDVKLAMELGFKGELLGVFPATGGFDIERMQRLRASGSVSSRRVIALKGTHDDHWAGRALVALQALHQCADSLAGYEVVIYRADQNVRHAAEDVSRITGLRITILPYCPHDEVLKLLGRARIAIGVSVTDGTPVSMLEAMIMSAFPIQSDTISTAEWISDGENGLLVPPENPQMIAAAIRRAVSDDALIDKAAEINGRLVAERLDYSVIQPQVIALYKKVAAEAHMKTRTLST